MILNWGIRRMHYGEISDFDYGVYEINDIILGFIDYFVRSL
jgi:hypothetical protein